MQESCHKLVKATEVKTAPTDTLALDYEARNRSRGKGTTSGGVEISWFLDRGVFLRHGDCLVAADDKLYEVEAAPEPVSHATTSDRHLLARAAYHLGNRHVALQIEADALTYQPDHVLDDMVSSLGLDDKQTERPFQPEDGAYHGGHRHD